jgi:hypothetical protein
MLLVTVLTSPLSFTAAVAGCRVSQSASGDVGVVGDLRDTPTPDLQESKSPDAAVLSTTATTHAAFAVFPTLDPAEFMHPKTSELAKLFSAKMEEAYAIRDDAVARLTHAQSSAADLELQLTAAKSAADVRDVTGAVCVCVCGVPYECPSPCACV